MTQTCEGQPPGERGGPGNSSCLEGIDSSAIAPKTAPSQAEISRNPRAVREAKLELLREAIFENLGAVSLFAETAKLLIEARDDAGMAHSVKMGAHHYRAAVVTANELAAFKEAP
jgi:hypothetical protein